MDVKKEGLLIECETIWEGRITLSSVWQKQIIAMKLEHANWKT